MEITIEQIVSVFKNTTDGMRLKDIKAAVVQSVTPAGELFLPADKEDIEKQVEELIKEDKKREIESYLKYNAGKYKKRPKKKAPDGTSEQLPGVYIGTAGETAVISELMFHGFNANRMMIDEGIDIVATKNNVYRYIQVKTTYVDKGKIYCQINKDRYDMHIESQLRYIIVARYSEKGVNRNMFFIFNSQDIDDGIYGRYIKQGLNCVSIKIKFHPQSGAPYLYDDKEHEISNRMNNFRIV